MFLRWLRRRRGKYRNLFRFDDGERIRSADPLIVAQLLSLHPEYRPEHLDAALSGDLAAQRVVAATAREVFQVEAYCDIDGTGLTEAESIDLLLAFDRYLAQLKKNTRPLSTWPSSTDATPTESSEATTKDSSRSGAPATGPPFAAPSACGSG